MGRPGAVIVLTPPGGGAGVLTEALARAGGLVAPRAGTPPFPEAVEALRPAAGRMTHRLTGRDLRGRGVRAAAERALEAALDGPGRPLLSGLRLALRVPLLADLLPDARFVLVRRDPETALDLALGGWRGGEVVSAPDLPGWDGPPWSLPLVAGWEALAGRPLGEVVGAQWAAIATTLLDDLEALDPVRWSVVDRTALLEEPRPVLERLCGFLGVAYDQALLAPVEAARRSTALRPAPVRTGDLEAALALAIPADARLRDVMAEHAAGPPDVSGAAAAETTLASRASPGFARTLDALGVSVVLTAEPVGALVTIRRRGPIPDTHFRAFDAPRAVAAAGDRIAVATGDELWVLRAGADGRFAPRARYALDVAVADLAYDGAGRLWAATPDGLAVLDGDDGLVVQRPGAVTGVATDAEGVAFVTAGDAVLAADGTVVADGLVHPCSPRRHEDRLLVLEAGRGALVAIGSGGAVDPVAELPGYARGLAVTATHAFAGLSQLRAPGAAVGLPVTARVGERRSGVWAIDLRSGEVAGFLRFVDLVQEVGGLALVARAWPDL